MKIEGSGRIDNARILRRPSAASSPDSSFKVSDSAEARPQVVSGPGPIAALESILTLQSVDDPASGASKGMERGEQLLGILDQVRDGLLAGGIPRATLNRLAVAVGKRHDNFVDPKLQDVLDEIELRAHVELAKLEQADMARAAASA
jgi:hypothetical protein